MDITNKTLDQLVQKNILDPVGGISRFRLVVCTGFKLVQYSDNEGEFHDLIIEDDKLAAATIFLLEKSNVLEIPREAR